MTWVYVLSKKSDVAETVKTDWLPMVERQQDRLVKAIRTDRGGEFLSKEFSLWLKKNGIRHSLTMPYSPAMNGIAERANRTITETARGLLIEAGLPDYFWPDAVRSACVAKNRALNHVGADKWVPYVEWIGRKPKVDMLRVFGKRWLLWDLFTKKFLVSKDCKFMENLMYKDWKAENEAKIGMRFGEVKSSGLEHVELPLELTSGSTTTRQTSLVNGAKEAKDEEEEEEEVQQVSERAPTLPSRTTSAPRIRVTPQQRQGLHVPAAEEEGRGKRRIQAPNRLTYDALGKPAKSALAGVALMVGDDEESEYEECAFAFFSPVEMPGEPATLKEALESSDAEEWKKAMESELKSIDENGTWELVELSEGRKAITSKWLFKIKSDADGKIKRYKSRLVAKGYQQKEKVDYKELFAPVVKPTTLRTLLADAAIKRWVVKQMDVTAAFLNGVLEEEIFMVQPERFDDGSGRVLKLKKALYGMKQALRQWYLKLRGVLEETASLPQRPITHCSCLARGSGGASWFYMEKRCMRVHQRKYLEALGANFGQSEGHVATPFPSGFKSVKGPEEESVGEEERHCFHSLVGSLMYAAVNTRPAVAFATGHAEGDCYLCVPPDPDIEAAALGASESALPGTAPAEALHTLTLDSVRLANPSGGPVFARSSTVLPCPAVPSSSLSDLHLPSFSTNLGRERYFLLVVDDYTRYTTVFSLRSKGEVPDVLIPWIRAVRLQLRERISQDLPVLRLHSDRGGEFSSNLLRDFCRGEGIHQSFTLPASPQQNEIAEHRIGLVMEVARTSMIHAAAPHFLWSFAVRYAAHQLNLWPRSRSFVRDTSADKLSSRAIPYTFLGFPLMRLAGSFTTPTRAVSFPLKTSRLTSQFLFTTHSQGLCLSGAARGASSGGVASGGAEPASAEPGGAEPADGEPGDAESEGAGSGVLSVGVRSLEVLSLRVRSLGRTRLRSGGAGARGSAAGGTRAGGAGVLAGAGGTEGAGAAGLGGARTRGARAVEAGGVRGAGAEGAGAGDPRAGGAGAGGPGAGSARARGAGGEDPGAGGAGVGDLGAGGAGVGGTGAGGPGASGAGAGGAGAGGARA
ncbi:unnamed protein product [Closterium sp. NIES-53]